MKMLEDLEEFLFLLRTISSRGVHVAEQVHSLKIVVLIPFRDDPLAGVM